MSVLMKQPNGLYCIYSNELKRITDINLTANEFVSFFCRKAELDPKTILERVPNAAIGYLSLDLQMKVSKPVEESHWEEV